MNAASKDPLANAGCLSSGVEDLCDGVVSTCLAIKYSKHKRNGINWTHLRSQLHTVDGRLEFCVESETPRKRAVLRRKNKRRTHSWQQLVELVRRVAACDPESQHNFLSRKLKRDCRLVEQRLNGDS